MQISGVDFLITFTCTSRCKHCSYRAGPERIGVMNVFDAEQWLRELSETQEITSLTIHGGEPFLYFDLLKEIIKRGRDLGILRRWVITNGFWAKTNAIAEQNLIELKEAGLTCMTFSVDAFHQEYVPLEHVRNGIMAATRFDFDKVCIDSYFVVAQNSNNRYDILTRQALERLEVIENVTINRYRVGLDGRGADHLVEFVDCQDEPPTGACQLPSWLGGNLQSPGAIEIDCEGNVTLCPGICIGNAQTQSLTDIVARYDYRKHPIIHTIAEEGPIGLLRQARKRGYNNNTKFVNECHLCYEMRRVLHDFYPRQLAPQACY